MSRILLTLALVCCAAACGNDGGLKPIPDMQSVDLPMPLVACKDTSECPGPSFVCAYKIADGCSAMGHCAPVRTPTCASITELCGCDGKLVEGGPCFFEDGYAGGPTNGQPLSACVDAGP
jgi:hypothetical protein